MLLPRRPGTASARRGPVPRHARLVHRARRATIRRRPRAFRRRTADS